MDIIAIILCALKKWKAALIVSIIGGLLVLLIAPFIPIFWISFIIYAITTIISINAISSQQQRTNTQGHTDASAFVQSADTIEKSLNDLESLYQRGIITEEEYLTSRRKVLGIR